jgi:hypothetical protein
MRVAVFLSENVSTLKEDQLWKFLDTNFFVGASLDPESASNLDIITLATA